MRVNRATGVFPSAIPNSFGSVQQKNLGVKIGPTVAENLIAVDPLRPVIKLLLRGVVGMSRNHQYFHLCLYNIARLGDNLDRP